MEEKKSKEETPEIKVINAEEVTREEKPNIQLETTESDRKTELAKLDSFQSVGEIMDFAKVLLKSGLVPSSFNTAEKVVTAIQQGRELGMGGVTALNNIHVIEGKAALSVHAIGALLRKANVAYQTVRNYEPEYEIDPMTGQEVLYKMVNEKPVKVTKEEGGKPRRIDTVTSIKFYRKWEGRVIEELVDFRWSEAVGQNLVEKSNWKKMPRIMMWNRCLAVGGRRVAPDALLGMYEVSEMADTKNITIELDEEGNPVEPSNKKQ